MNFKKNLEKDMKKEYLREFDALEMLLETVAKFRNKMSKPVITFFYQIDKKSSK
jgi:hypothetical protein